MRHHLHNYLLSKHLGQSDFPPNGNYLDLWTYSGYYYSVGREENGWAQGVSSVHGSACGLTCVYPNYPERTSPGGRRRLVGVSIDLGHTGTAVTGRDA